MTQLRTYDPQVMPVQSGRPAGDNADDKSLFQILWRRRRIVGSGVAVALAAGVLYLLIAAPVYTAVSRLFIDAAGGKKAGQDAADRAAFLYTQREVVTSTPVLADALNVPGLMDFETFAKERDPITGLRNKLSVDVGKKDELVSVSLESKYPNEATQIVSAVVNAYKKFQITQRTALTSDTLRDLESEKKASDAEIADRTKALQAFSMEHRIVGPEAATSSDSDSLKAIAASLTQAHLDSLNAAARLSAVRPPADAVAPDDDATYTVEDEANVRQQLLTAESSLEALSSKYPASNPFVRAAKARVDQLKRHRYAMLLSVKTAAEKREADLRAFYEAEQRGHIEQRAFAADYVRMSADLQRLQERADAIDSRLRDLKVNDEGKMANVSVLDPAHIDVLATGPKKSRVLGIALAAGVMLGVLAALAWDQFDTRFESAAEINRWLGLSTLGVLPALPGSRSPSAQALYGYSEPNSAFAVACQNIWAAMHAVGHGTQLKTLAVTSPSHGDGRTTAACGLAIAMAQHGRRVLLIDADVVAPKLAALLGVDTGGLADLFGAPSIDAALVRRFTRETIVPNLVLLCGGRVAVEGPNLASVLDVASREYDVVIIDTPPARKHAAARVVAAHCQAAVMVVRSGHTDCFTAGRVRNDLYNVGANVLGVVLNQAHAGGQVPTVVTAAYPPAAMPAPRDALGLPASEKSTRPAGGLSVAS